MVLPGSTFYPIAEKPVDSPSLNAFEQRLDSRGTQSIFNSKHFNLKQHQTRFEFGRDSLVLLEMFSEVPTILRMF